MNDSKTNYNEVSELIEELNLTGIDVLNLFTDYQGMQVMTDNFTQFVKDEFLPE